MVKWLALHSKAKINRLSIPQDEPHASYLLPMGLARGGKPWMIRREARMIDGEAFYYERADERYVGSGLLLWSRKAFMHHKIFLQRAAAARQLWGGVYITIVSGRQIHVRLSTARQWLSRGKEKSRRWRWFMSFCETLFCETKARRKNIIDSRSTFIIDQSVRKRDFECCVTTNVTAIVTAIVTKMYFLV